MDQVSPRSGFNQAANADFKSRFDKAYDRLTAKICFASEKESIKPGNVERTKFAFREFLVEMNWPLAQWCFEDLLEEKRGEHLFRSDGKTPNWYHEFRECLYLLGKMRAGMLKEKDLIRYGGMEVCIATNLRHDSWEDMGKDRLAIFAPIERKLHEYEKDQVIDDAFLYDCRRRATLVIEGVDRLTRKTPVLNGEGYFVRKENGRLKKVDRYDGDANLYMNAVGEWPTTALCKYEDLNEGMQTRIGVDRFTPEDNAIYIEERRALFSGRNFSSEVSTRFPFIKEAIESSDSMMGILVAGMTAVNTYSRPNFNPANGKPLDLGKYVRKARAGYAHIPPCFHPIHIFIGRLEGRAQTDPDMKVRINTRNLLDNIIRPPLERKRHFGLVMPERGQPPERHAAPAPAA